MSLTTTISVQDGSLAAVNLTAGQAVNVTPGNTAVIAPQVTTGMLSWTVVIKSDYGPINGTGGTFTGPLFQYNLPLPIQPCTITVFSEATDGNNFYQTQNVLYNYPRTGTTTHSVAYVQPLSTNIANANCNCDGVQPVAGDIILLVNQSNAAQNGPYVVGALTANIAALTRPPDYATGQVLRVPQVFEVAAGGTSWGGSTWKIMVPTGASNATSGLVTVDTTSTTLYPRVLKGSISNVATANAAANVTGLWILANTTPVFVNSNSAANSATYVSANVGNLANAGFFTVTSSASAAGVYFVQNW